METLKIKDVKTGRLRLSFWNSQKTHPNNTQHVCKETVCSSWSQRLSAACNCRLVWLYKLRTTLVCDCSTAICFLAFFKKRFILNSVCCMCVCVHSAIWMQIPEQEEKGSRFSGAGPKSSCELPGMVVGDKAGLCISITHSELLSHLSRPFPFLLYY